MIRDPDDETRDVLRIRTRAPRSFYAGSVRRETPDPRACPTCGDPLKPEILDDERFLVAWSCLNCGVVRTTEPT